MNHPRQPEGKSLTQCHWDFKPSWSKTGSFYVMQGKVGDEVALTDDSFHTWAHSCLRDGRMLVNALHPTLGWGVYLMTPRAGGRPSYDRVQCDLAAKGRLHRASIFSSASGLAALARSGLVAGSGR